MKITLSPQISDLALDLVRDGDALGINGALYDFSALPDGATLPAGAVDCDWIVGPVERIGGVLHVTVRLPIPVMATAEQRFPAPIVDPPDGPVALPPGPPEPEPEQYPEMQGEG